MVPAFVRTFAGPWRIVEMVFWDNDFLDLVEKAHSTFQAPRMTNQASSANANDFFNSLLAGAN